MYSEKHEKEQLDENIINVKDNELDRVKKHLTRANQHCEKKDKQLKSKNIKKRRV